MIKIVGIEEENLLNDWSNFNEIFSQHATYDNIKSTKEQDFTLFLKNTFLEKPEAAEIQMCLNVNYFLQVRVRGVFRDLSNISNEAF